MISIRSAVLAACMTGMIALGAVSQASAADRHVVIKNHTAKAAAGGTIYWSLLKKNPA